MTRLDDLRIVKDLVAASRRYHWTHLAIGFVVWAYFAAYVILVPIETTWAKVRVGLLVLTSLQEIMLIRGLVRLRARGPVVSALFERPEEIASVTGWPANMKFPEGKYPGSLHVTTRSGAVASVRVTDQVIQQVVGALHTRSPDARIAVQNVVLPPKRDASSST